ncbi:DUF6932 family protein [Armatimonas rosea]|uniref:Nucleotidyltransferase domain-containing protein n=1 Tax=Armatimonas rosea TaxID=685828 RepID=A0A7W9SNZ8_ARMRO|nr:hypothetical protein [Armatimonas rosea]MBB6050152.1 hypothetical protein [Armatimonas rosea]
MPLPAFQSDGNLPEGIYSASWSELAEHFGGTERRQQLLQRLEQLYGLASATTFLERFVVFGSFVTTKPEPGDVDVILVMRPGFQSARVGEPACFLFDHDEEDRRFGASIFWIRTDLLILETVEEFLDYWQTRRDGGRRGIIEVVP